MNVLITGGAGFLGAHLGEALARNGHQAVLFDLNFEHSILSTNLFPNYQQVPKVSGDILDGSKLEEAIHGYKVDHAVHLATLLTDACEQDPVRATEINCLGTATVFEVCTRTAIKKVLFGSSVAVFRADPTLPEGDERPYHPITVYGATKVYGELLAAALKKSRPGTEFLALRFGWVYGPGRKRGWNEIQKVLEDFALEKETVRYPDYQEPNDWTYVNDAVGAILRCLDAPRSEATAYNFSGDYRPISDAIAFLRKLFPAVRVEPYEAQLPAVAWNFTSDRIVEATGFAASTSLEEGIYQTVNLIRQIHNLRPV
jgi:UDP-glucose 4-epimerase